MASVQEVARWSNFNGTRYKIEFIGFFYFSSEQFEGTNSIHLKIDFFFSSVNFRSCNFTLVTHLIESNERNALTVETGAARVSLIITNYTSHVELLIC